MPESPDKNQLSFFLEDKFRSRMRFLYEMLGSLSSEIDAVHKRYKNEVLRRVPRTAGMLNLKIVKRKSKCGKYTINSQLRWVRVYPKFDIDSNGNPIADKDATVISSLVKGNLEINWQFEKCVYVKLMRKEITSFNRELKKLNKVSAKLSEMMSGLRSSLGWLHIFDDVDYVTIDQFHDAMPQLKTPMKDGIANTISKSERKLLTELNSIRNKKNKKFEEINILNHREKELNDKLNSIRGDDVKEDIKKEESASSKTPLTVNQEEDDFFGQFEWPEK